MILKHSRDSVTWRKWHSTLQRARTYRHATVFFTATENNTSRYWAMRGGLPARRVYKAYSSLSACWYAVLRTCCIPAAYLALMAYTSSSHRSADPIKAQAAHGPWAAPCAKMQSDPAGKRWL